MRPRAHRSGFTLLEMTIALTIFSVVGYCLAVALEVGSHSQGTVDQVSAQDRALREASSILSDDIQGSNDAHMTASTLSDGNHQVLLLHPIDVGSTATWGVHDLTLGHDATTQNRAGWKVRYRAVNVTANGAVTKQLVREILDASNVIQRERVLVEGLRAGTVSPAGFRIVKTGDVWEVTLSTEGEVDGTTGMRAVFHVQARN